MSQTVKKALGLLYKTVTSQFSVEGDSVDTMPSCELDQLRFQIVERLRHGQDCTASCDVLIQVDSSVNINDRYSVIDVSQLVLWNNKDLESLQCIQHALSFIHKFAKHLTKPVTERVPQWREIKFSNVHVENKLKPMKGFEVILQQLGYTEVQEYGLSFPEGCEPNQEEVYNIIADIVLLKRELDIYIHGIHPNSCLLDSLLSQDVRDGIVALQVSGEQFEYKEDLDMSLFPRQEQDTRALPAGPMQESVTNEDNKAKVAESVLPVSVQQMKIEIKEEEDENYCSLPTEAKQEVVEGIQDLALVDNVDAGLNSSGGALNTSCTSSNSRLACDVCGEDAVGYCAECHQKTLCDGCNFKWHQHPQRRGHILHKVNSASSLPLDSDTTGVHIDGAYGVMAQDTQSRNRYKASSHKNTSEVKKEQQSTIRNEPMHRPDVHQLNDYPHQIPMQFDRPPPQQPVQIGYPQMLVQGHPNAALNQGYLAQAGLGEDQSHGYPTHHQANMIYPGQTMRPSGPQYASTMSQMYGQDGLSSSRMPYPPATRASSPTPQIPHYIAQQLHEENIKAGFPVQGTPYSTYNNNAANMQMYRNRQSQDLGLAQPVYPHPVSGFSQRDTLPMQSFHHGASMQPYPPSHQHPQSLRYPYSGAGTIYRGPSVYQNYPNQPAVPMVSTQGGGLLAQPTNDPSKTSFPNSLMSQTNMSSTRQSTNPQESDQRNKPSLASSSSSLDGFQSRLVKRLMRETDFNKRRASCDFHVENLVLDLNELKEEIDAKMVEGGDEFINSEEFQEMNKRKLNLLKEKRAVENFRKQLDEETVLVRLPSEQQPPSDPHQKIFYPPVLDQPPANVLDAQAGAEFLGAIPAKTNMTVVTPSNLNVQNQGKILNIDPHQPLNTSLATQEPQMDLTPPRPPPIAAVAGAIKKIPQTSEHETPAAKDSTLDMTFPPPKPEHKTQPLVPLRPKPKPKPPASRDSMLDITFPPPKLGHNSPKQWHCEHCTFINDATCHACMICHKTSDNPQLVNSSFSDSDDDNEVGPISEFGKEFGNDSFIIMLNEIAEEEKLKNQTGTVTKEVGARIDGIQDEVYKEKKQAQQKDLEQQKNQGQGQKEPGRIEQSPSPTSLYGSPSSNTQERNPRSSSPHSVNSPSTKNKIHSIATTRSSSSSVDFQTPPSRVSPSPADPQGAGDKVMAEQSVQEVLGRLSQQNKINSLQAEGAQLAQWVKMADREGYEVDAVSIALVQCCNQDIDPVQWLRTNWTNNVSQVAERAKAKGRQDEENSVGELSLAEAQAAYMSCHGNMVEAVELCVKERKQLYVYLSAMGDYPREEILDAMKQSCGNKATSEHLLQGSKLNPFIDRIWAQQATTDSDDRFRLSNMNNADAYRSFSTSIINHGDFQNNLKDVTINLDRRIRMIFAEGRLKSWGRAEMVINILDEGVEGTEICLEDIVEAVRNCRDRTSALAYLQQECQICFSTFPMSKIQTLMVCQCKLCKECLTQNFEVNIKDKHVRQWTCPNCSLPDLNDVDAASEYIQFLTMLLQPLITQETLNLFETKVRDWHLQKEKNFRWCAHCAEGFIAEAGILKMVCPHCRYMTCYQCKKKWEPQHEGLTCDQFNQWKIDNDPNNQSVGLAKHLDQNGIDCPNCKMRFDLAKGGCMHFKCPECGHEFCSGCNEPYHHKNVCKKYKNCALLGFHCHCPRDCFSNLRDFGVDRLQELLNKNNVPFNVEIPDDQEDADRCPVMEQKEFGTACKDEKCGKDTQEGHAGLCELHYKEYLSGIINQHRLDPVIVMNKEEMITVLRKYDVQIPAQHPEETPAVFGQRLAKIIKEKLAPRRNA